MCASSLHLSKFRPDGHLYKASERLADAEASASADHRRAQRDPNAFHSSIYPPGTEFALCHAESQLMSAVVGVLNESLTESIKGFYKLRKAYTILDSILAAEARYLQTEADKVIGAVGTGLANSLRAQRSGGALKGMAGASDDSPGHSAPRSGPPSVRDLDLSRRDSHRKILHSSAAEDSMSDDLTKNEDVFFDATENVAPEEVPSTYTGLLEIHGVQKDLTQISLTDDSRPGSSDMHKTLRPPARHNSIDHGPDSNLFSNPIDIFIHSGANLCFGLLNIMISMIPPAFGKLLYIIGFHGDKDRGIRMLWQASKFHNVNGAFAGLVILGYYNTLVGFSDIIPDKESGSASEDGLEGYPKERCEDLLVDMRSRHPKSHLWLLEEARREAANRNLSKALDLLIHSSKSALKQVEALEMFETSLNAMYSHKYRLCSESFVACVSLNNWSHALYYYIAGAAEVELYREHKRSDPKAAAVYAKKAIELLQQAPMHAGKKKFMARQLPFDVFVTRKLKKWEARSHELGVRLIDAIGVSPLEEMIFFWNGYKRMGETHLRHSLKVLSSWSEDTQFNPLWKKEQADERAILALLQGTTLRNLHQLEDARQIIQVGVLDIERTELKGGLRDDWTAPAAHYEMGVTCWMRRGEVAEAGEGLEMEQRWVKECESWVEKAAKWESYELDARIGLKIATAQDTLKKWRERRGASGRHDGSQ